MNDFANLHICNSVSNLGSSLLFAYHSAYMDRINSTRSGSGACVVRLFVYY